MRDVWDCGIDQNALQRYIDEQIYTLPGTERHRELFTVLLTGSRALGTYSPTSDVDIDVLCPEDVYKSVQKASLEKGIIKSQISFWCPMGLQEDWQRYFGAEVGPPHFSLLTLESVKRQFEDYDDIGIWIWTNARVLSDPGGQFQKILDSFKCYPKDVLVRKIKYHWLMCWYWGIEVYPHQQRNDGDFVVAAAAISNAILEMQKVFFLVEGRPFPYVEKLPSYMADTKLGRQFGPWLQQIVDLVVGKAEPQLEPWERLGKASKLLLDDVEVSETMRLEEEVVKAIIAAGVEPEWMDNYYSNIDELLLGRLGPVPR